MACILSRHSGSSAARDRDEADARRMISQVTSLALQIRNNFRVIALSILEMTLAPFTTFFGLIRHLFNLWDWTQRK
jgi:hypothetical protein